ncbi:MAG: response regulator [Anaerolineae bacterium]|nr:response regulator [Anaerolineae bacterium]
MEKGDTVQESITEPRLLLVDDEPNIRTAVGRALRLMGYKKVEEANSGSKALEMLEQASYDLLLLDMHMPDMDGIAVMTRARQLYPELLIVILTGNATLKNAIAAVKLEAIDYLQKPARIQDIAKAVTSALQRKRIGQSLETLKQENERLRREKLELLYRIEKQEKASEAKVIPLDRLGQLVSGIVHDLRGGLGVIRNTIGFIVDDLDTDNPLMDDIEKIVYSAEFCEIVLRNLMMLGSDEVFNPIEVSLEGIIREVFFMLERKLVDVNLVVDSDPNTRTILADEGQMKQMFMNLFKNAGEAMPEGGTLTVHTQRVGEMVRVKISDTGTGIAMENLDRIFDLYFTTKENGFGVGLYIVKSVVERHGGTISVVSEIGRGTTFTLYLPI